MDIAAGDLRHNRDRPVRSVFMMSQRIAPPIAACAALVLFTACDAVERARSRFGTTTTDTVVTAAGSGVALGLQSPPLLHAGQEGVLRLSLTNQTDTVVSQVRLELIVPQWAEPLAPRVGDRPVTMAALETGSTQFSYRLDDAPLNPNQVQTVEQRIRVAPSSAMTTQSNAPWTRTVRARLLASDGRTLAEVQTELGVDSAALAATPAAATQGPPARRERVGPAELGMTAAAVRQAAPGTRDTTWAQGGARARGLVVPIADRNALAILAGDVVARIEVSDPAIQTAERLGVGASVDQLRAAYGNPCAEVIGGRAVLWFAAVPGIAFAIDMQAPRDPAQLEPARIPGSAKVTRWWMSRDVELCPTGG
jgi:hypothetical protein